MTSHTLTTHVKSAAWAQNEVMNMNQQDLEAPGSLLSKSHPVWLIFKNMTDFPLSKTGEHFYSGDWFGNAVFDAAPWSISGIAAADKKGGCTGGASFKLLLGDDLNFDFSIGFTDPLKGSNKMCCIAGRNAEAAYNRANEYDTDNAVKSPDNYIATTTTGKTSRFQFQVSVSRPGSPKGEKDSCKIYIMVQRIPY
ncbi:hypothetical protein AUEXF2481DRAFT_45003 [Aureobasidium subglaciale EXF-2481]|uniref:Uncharacterized protein n=1 Tax=Aureobasidium subglaciale (strain EXF-2481) TaxID=1043005 RepID=A0A074Y8K8_AURSE|nr:uncharacterized protein AUEXF2481DRAFT_45003 [Aureobasidium subglaciale EXF-2481]KAI5196340.1 hypothetical protein E4T38_08575 [Aureobasidium subglaciale]KAI5215123.1 hypothetical protein E4T40_08588 [Aureobasidium subglaciale]KAI5218298.1 hypothetical protein E4T41_08441 [Aureobasidium subglaciale]KAI5256037.1 hypothetical protein E4T46_08476 [Aureobasidium subglaciale]KEQ90547.1 hypothetical protein AUEXF2481DRAFT_45003 [Aureobasidium subglaciale EXF-2481]